MILMIILLFFLINLFFFDFLKFLMFSELMISFFFFFFFLLMMNNFSMTLIFISIMIIEGSLGIFILFEFNLSKKNLFYLNKSSL